MKSKLLSKKLKSEWSLKEPLFVDAKDRRYKRYCKQLETNGFSDTETWSLDTTIAKFILPRLKRFKEINNGFPGTLSEEKWNEILDKMIFAFEFTLIEHKWPENKPGYNDAYKTYEEGFKLFTEHFTDLWW